MSENKQAAPIPSFSPIHEWFELSYASYLVLPRTLLQSMPQEWQERLIVLLGELGAAFPELLCSDVTYDVRTKRDGKVVPDPLGDYERGRRRIEPARREG